MVTSALLAYAHYISILGVVGSLLAEALILTSRLTPRERRLLGKADAVYGISAILVLITGFTRVFYLGKGSEYYFSNPVFLAKLGIFIIVGILSAYPTVVFMKWRKSTEVVLEVEPRQFATLRSLIYLEVILVFFMPLLAALMARGIGG